MLVRLYKSQLADALQTVAKAVERKASAFYLQAVKLTFEKDYLIMQTTNLERFLTIKVPLEQVGLFVEPRTVHVDGIKFAKFVKELDEEILFAPEDTYLEVKSGKAKARFLVISEADLPEFPEPVYDIEFDAKLLLDAIEKVSFAISKETDNLKCLLIDGKEDHINFVGSDGYRLVIYKYPMSFDKRFRLHVSGLALLKDLLDETDTVKLGATENMTFVATDLWELALRNAENEYPDYEAVIPSDYSCRVVFYANEMQKALKRLLTFGKDAVGVEMFVDSNEITMKTQSPDYGEIEVKVSVWDGSGDMHLAFNGKYLKEFIDNAEGKVEMKLVDAESPMVFENGENYIYVLMPMRL
ncbi:DNA polymerase III subunit beta [Thermocrinis sp.]|jgi:DNA polymerase-3 subunit beta|uniref:DNA polymerase III subunit beta n=1 Tax=Thermocrinis sp. TaxID=2024383 RepID=UPI003C0C297D